MLDLGASTGGGARRALANGADRSDRAARGRRLARRRPPGSGWASAPERVGRPAFVAEGRPRRASAQRLARAGRAPAPHPIPARPPGRAGPGGRRHGGGAVRLRGARSGHARRRRGPGRAPRASCAPAGSTRLLADPVVSARVALATKGAVTTRAGQRRPQQPRVLAAVAPLRAACGSGRPTPRWWRPRTPASSPSGSTRRAWPIASEPIGARVLFQPVGPLPTAPRCRPTDWRVSARGARRGRPGARYVVDARFRDPMRIDDPPPGAPVGLDPRTRPFSGSELSDDGRSWRRPWTSRGACREWAWAGRTLFAFSGGVDRDGPGRRARERAVRVEVLPAVPRVRDAITALCVRGVT